MAGPPTFGSGHTTISSDVVNSTTKPMDNTTIQEEDKSTTEPPSYDVFGEIKFLSIYCKKFSGEVRHDFFSGQNLEEKEEEKEEGSSNSCQQPETRCLPVASSSLHYITAQWSF